jgi:hypothetical protein
LGENLLNSSFNNFVILHNVLYIEVIMNRAEIEYLKKVNDIRKKMGLALNPDQCKRKSFLLTLAEIRAQKIAN